MRTYETTHPWLKFVLDLPQAPLSLWLSLGEIRSKCDHVAGVPLNQETADRLHRLALVRGVRATTAIEGNSLTEEQVRQRIEGELKLPQSQEYLGKEIDNVVSACNQVLRDMVQGKPVDLTPAVVQGFNKTILEGLPLPANVAPGEIRTYPVGVGSYPGAPAQDCFFLLQRLCEFLNLSRNGIPGMDRTSAAVLLAVIAHLYIAWIHPFGDGNGRTARLLEFMLLLEAGVPAPAAHLLSNHYNMTRQVYYLQLDRTSKSGGDVIPFVEYAISGLVDGLRSQLDEIKSYQHKIIWRDHVSHLVEHRKPGESAEVRTRRRELVEALSSQSRFFSNSEVLDLTPATAKAYARKTRKTLSRDLNVLRDMGLVDIGPNGARARTETALAFLPPKRNAPLAKSP